MTEIQFTRNVFCVCNLPITISSLKDVTKFPSEALEMFPTEVIAYSVAKSSDMGEDPIEGSNRTV